MLQVWPWVRFGSDPGCCGLVIGAVTPDSRAVVRDSRVPAPDCAKFSGLSAILRGKPGDWRKTRWFWLVGGE